MRCATYRVTRFEKRSRTVTLKENKSALATRHLKYISQCSRLPQTELVAVIAVVTACEKRELNSIFSNHDSLFSDAVYASVALDFRKRFSSAATRRSLRLRRRRYGIYVTVSGSMLVEARFSNARN